MRSGFTVADFCSSVTDVVLLNVSSDQVTLGARYSLPCPASKQIGRSHGGNCHDERRAEEQEFGQANDVAYSMSACPSFDRAQEERELRREIYSLFEAYSAKEGERRLAEVMVLGYGTKTAARDQVQLTGSRRSRPNSAIFFAMACTS